MKTKAIPSLKSMLCQVMSDVLLAKGGKEMTNVMFTGGYDLKPIVRIEEVLGRPVMTISAEGMIESPATVHSKHIPDARRVDGKLGKAGGDVLWQFLNRVLRISINEIVGQFSGGKGPNITLDDIAFGNSLLGGFTLFTMKRAQVPFTRKFCLVFHDPRGKNNIMRNRNDNDIIAAMCGQISSKGNQPKWNTNMHDFVNADLVTTVANMHRHTRAEIDFSQFIICTNSTSTTVQFPDEVPAKGHVEDLMENFLDKPLAEQIPAGAVIVAAHREPEVVDIKMSVDVQPTEMIGIPQPATTPVGDFGEGDQQFGSYEPASGPRWVQPEDGAVYEHVIDIVGTQFVQDSKLYCELMAMQQQTNLSDKLREALQDEAFEIVFKWSGILAVTQDNAEDFLKKYAGK